MAREYAVSRAALLPSPYSVSTAARYIFSRSVGAAAWRAAGVGPSRWRTARARSTSCSLHSGWVYVSASPQ